MCSQQFTQPTKILIYQGEKNAALFIDVTKITNIYVPYFQTQKTELCHLSYSQLRME